MTSQFGPSLRRLRARAGLTQEALAERSGLSVRTIRGLETGKHGDPRMGTVDALAAALDLTAAERAELLAVDTSPKPVDELAEAASLLAYELRARLRREEEQRQIHDPVPLPVRWLAAPTELIDSWTNIRRAEPVVAVRPLNLAGELDEIVDVYKKIPSRRLVVLGSAGSGKTILAMRFVLGLLDVKAPGDPVPVIFSVGSWHPATTPLRDWLIEQLIRDHPGLAAPVRWEGTTLAAALVETGRILPVLDGFDEIAGGLHRAALAALNATTLPLLVTSRVDEYRAAVESTSVLRGAGAVVLSELTVADLVGYLPRTTRREGSEGSVWEPVLTRLRDEPDGDLAAVLTTPLMVSLARTIYSDTPGHDPAELLTRFGTRDAIERHLTASFVPTVYHHPPAGREHDVERVENWLGFLAHHLDRLGTYDLAWWQLGDRMSVWLRMLVSGTVLGVAAGVVAALILGLIHSVIAGTAGGGLANGLSVAFSAGPLEGFASGMTVGLAHGASLLIRNTIFEPSRVRFQLRIARGDRILRRFLSGLSIGVGLGGGLGIARELDATFWIVGRIGDTALVSVLFGLAFGVVCGLVWAVAANFERPVDISSAASPMDLLNSNRRTVLIQSVMFGVVTWLVYLVAVVVAHGLRFGLIYGLSYGLVLGLAVFLGSASLTAWGTWLVFARVWLPLTGRLPWDLPDFLAEAYRRGVLRRAGAVYQFRHARLQDHLKRAYRAGR